MNPLQSHSFTASMLETTALDLVPAPLKQRAVGMLLVAGATVALGALAYVGTRNDRVKTASGTPPESAWKRELKEAVREVVREESAGLSR